MKWSLKSKGKMDSICIFLQLYMEMVANISKFQNKWFCLAKFIIYLNLNSNFL